MKLQKSEFVITLLTIGSFFVGAYVYPKLPAQVAAHWDMYGQVNGYLSQFWGAFLLPLILVAMLLFFLLIPRLDPKRQNIDKFREHFNVFSIIVFLFLVYIYALTIIWNLGYIFDFNTLLVPAFAILFYCLGILVSKAEPNWSIGIRTPWTLASTEVWRKTHALGSMLFKLSSILSLIGLLFPVWAFWFTIIPIISTTIIVVLYSFFVYHRLKS